MIAGYRTEDLLINLPEFKEPRGTLTVAQWSESFPFEVKRVFFVHGVPPEATRGGHAHKECMQILLCLNGQIELVLDDGEEKVSFSLADSSQAVMIPVGVWAYQHKHTPNSVLVVFASHDFDANDYVHKYEEFLAYKKLDIV